MLDSATQQRESAMVQCMYLPLNLPPPIPSYPPRLSGHQAEPPSVIQLQCFNVSLLIQCCKRESRSNNGVLHFNSGEISFDRSSGKLQNYAKASPKASMRSENYTLCFILIFNS